MNAWALTSGVKLYVSRRLPRLVTKSPWGSSMSLRVQRSDDVNRPPLRIVSVGARLVWLPERKPPMFHDSAPEIHCFRSVFAIPAKNGLTYRPAGTMTPG